MAKGTCPVGLEWEALVAAVGEYEAMRDFMENDETVRPVDEVLEKLAQENRYLQESEVPSPNPPKSLELMGEKEVRDLQNTMEVKMVDERNENLTAKAGQSYVFLNKRDAERFTKVVENEKGYPKEFVVTKKITRYERSKNNPLVKYPYNEYVDVVYRKSNKNKKSNLYDIVLDDEIIAEKVRVLSVSKDVKSEIAEKYGLVYTPTKVFNANRSIAFALYRQKPSKAKYVAQAKRYLYDAIKFLNPDETGGLRINLDEIAQMLDAFPDEMWDYINTTYGMDSSASTRINASISLARSIKFRLPKLGLAQELEKIVGFKLIGESFKAYDRSGGLQKILRVEWGDVVVIDPSTMSTRQLMVAISYYLKKKNYFKASSEYTNVAKYAEHNNIDPDKLYKLVFGSMDEAIENIAYNQSGNSDEMEVSKWRDGIKNYDWQAVELFDKPYEQFREKAKERITEKFKDKKLSNGISHLDFFFSGNFNWLNINFNNMSGTYYLPDMETEGRVGVDGRNPFVMDFNKPMAGNHFLKEEEVFNRLAAILHEPFHALHALAYGTKEEKDLRKAFDDLSGTAFGKEMLNQVFGSGYNQGKPVSFDTMYKEFVAFTGQLMLYPKEWINRTDLRSNDIYDFILKIQGLQDKTYREIVRTQKKMGSVKKTVMEERTETETVQETEQIKLNFLEKLYNFIVKALNDIIPLSRKFFNIIEESRVISKEVTRSYLEPVEVEEDVFGTEEQEVTKVKPLPAKIKRDKEAFLEAMENFKSAVVTLMQVDTASFSSDNMTSFFQKGGYEQEAGSMNSDNMNYYREQTIQDVDNDIIEEQGDLPMQPSQQNQTRAREILTKLMNKLSEALGVPYQVITGEEAKEMTKGSRTPWNGEKGFYMNGIAYFVGDNLTTNVVFHEFAHPFVEAIRKSNPTLYQNIYSKLLSSPEGQQIIDTVKQLYPELEVNSDMFMDEVITRAVEKLAVNKSMGQGSSKGLIDAVKDFFYWVKTKLRELFGKKINISKLDQNTTLDQLADMLVKGGRFNITTEMVSSSDIARYMKNMTQEINETSRIKNDDLVQLATQGFKAAIRSLEGIREKKDYLEMLEVFKDELGQSNFEEIKRNLLQYTKELDERTSDMIDKMKYTQDHVESLVNTFFRLSRTIRKISNHLTTLVKDVDNPENIAKAQNYARTLNFWSSFITFSLETFEKNGLSSENEIYKLVASISEEIVRGNKHLSKINGEGAKAILMKRLAPIGQAMIERMDSILKTYRKNGSPQSMIDRVYIQMYGMTEAEFNEYEKLKSDGKQMTQRYQMLNEKLLSGAFVSEEKIEALLSGELNDVNWMNSYMEGYLYNDDYVVGGFSLFVKDAIDEVFVRSQAKYNDFATEILPLLEKNGYNPNNIGELGKKLGFVDSILVYDRESGKYEKKELWTFLNPWKDYRYQRDLLKQNINDAREKFMMTNTDEDRLALADAVNAMAQHDINYMHQEFVPEYYERRNRFTDYGNDQLAVDALVKRDEILRAIRNLQQQAYNEKGFMEVAKQIDEKWNEYNLLHSLYDTNGKLKKDVQVVKDPDTGKEMEIVTNDLAIAKKLIEFRDEMSKYQEYVPIAGAFDGALKRYEQELLNQGITGDAFAKARNAWIDRNTRVVIKKEFWEKRRQIMTRVKELLSKLPRPEEKIRQLDEAFKNINDAVIGFRDEDGQPNGTALSPGRLKLVKESMDTIERLKEEIPTTFGLTNAQREELEYLENMEAYSFAGLNDQDYKKLVALRELRKKNLKDFTKEMGSELRGLLKSLEELQSNMPTEYYLGQLNAVIENIDSDEVKEQLKFTFGPDKLDADAANNLLNIGPADRYRNMLVKLMQNADFKAWFEANHIKKTRRVYDTESETYTQEVYYQRLYTWNVIRPNDPQYYEQHQILDENGKPVGDPIKGLPSRRFYKREVKDEYRTGYDKATKQVKLIVGVHVDNRNEWLPRETAPNNPYRNQAYYDLKANDPRLFELLEAMKRKHLEFQEGLDKGSKLYLDFPRFAKSNLELLQTKKDTKVKGNWLRLLLRRIKEFFKGSKEEPESGHNWNDDYKVATLDIFDKDGESIPIRGLYDIQIDDVSTDITNSMLRYMISAEENKRLTEIHPVAIALRETLKTNGADNFRKMIKRNLVVNGESNYRDKDMNRVRREVVNNFIERTFYGQMNKGPFQDNQFLQNLSQGIFQMASLGFFAFNIPSALKNQLGAKIQNFIEGAAGMHYNLKDLAKGEIWSNATMGEISMQIYKKSPKSLNVQLWEVFDPVFSYQQKAKKEGMSRTFLKDLTEPTGIMLNFRKWTEMQGSMQLFAAMLYSTKVKMGDKTISLIDAWEVREGKIQLKEGVDPEYGITYDADGNQKIGKKFLEVKNKIQAVHRNLQGAYDDFNQPEAQRYLAFRYVSYLRRYFTTMLMDRFSFKYKNGEIQPRFNPGLGTMHEGFYVTFLRYLLDIFRHGPKRLVYATPEERRAIMKTLVDAAILAIMTLVISMLFGWDPDDDERYEKLRQKSGPLRLFPFVAEDEYAFHMGGWLSNHALNLVMQMRSEQNQFLPLPGMGLDDYKEMITEVGSSAAFGPTLEMGFSLVQDIYWMGTGSEKAWYQREVGPYTWQQEGGSKFLAHLAKMAAFTGTATDPAVGVKSFESIELGFNR